jgi:rhodanese-related sulfurtransferase
MPNPFGAPEIEVQEVARKQSAGARFVWLDVREPAEYMVASIKDEMIVQVPLSRLVEQQLKALPEQALDQAGEIVVFCHHGIRSAQVVAWLRQQGWSNALNMAGGIDAWAKEIDPSVGVY